MNNSILVVGNGVWGNKLRNLFTGWGFRVQLCGARKFLTLTSKEKEFISTNHTVWIASTPDLQIEVIAELSNSRNIQRLIIEKPFFRDHQEKIKFFEVMNCTKVNISASSPWLYSDIWLKSKPKILKLFAPLHFSILRSGPVRNKSIPPHLDWLTHDVQLISNLFYSETSLETFQRIKRDVDNDFGKINIEFTNGSTLEMRGGISKNKESRWLVQDSNKDEFEVDFNKRLYRHYTNKESLNFEYKSPNNDNPLLNMYTHFRNNPEERNMKSFFQWQSMLI